MARAKVQYDGGSPAEVMRSLVSAARRGVEAAARHFDDELLDDHFAPGASEKYGYAKRSGEGEPAYVPSARGIVLAGGKSKYGGARVKQNPKYYHRKAREGFGKTALVRTGEMKKQALSGGRVGSRAAGSTVEGYDAVPVPAYAFKRPRNSKADKARELTTATAAEERQLEAVVEKAAAGAVNRSGRRQTKSLR